MSDRERFGPSRGDAMSTDVVTADGRARVLADGNEIPLVGLGVWQVANDREGVDAVRWALEIGHCWYRSCCAFSWLRPFVVAGSRSGRCPPGAGVEARRACPALDRKR